MTDRDNGDFTGDLAGDFGDEQIAQPRPPQPPAAGADQPALPRPDDPLVRREEPYVPPPGGSAPAPWEKVPTHHYEGWQTAVPGYPGYQVQGQPRPGAERGPRARHPEPPAGWVSPPRGQRSEPAGWDTPRESPPPWGEGGAQLPARWGTAPPAAPAISPTANWSYVDQIRTSDLVPARKTPPARGWRRALFSATFGVVNLGQSPDERRQAELETKIRTMLRGGYKIGVLGKGGVGKTTLATCVGSVFAQLRQDDRVVAVDADTAFGKLGSRIDPTAAGSYWDLAADQYLNSFADVRSRVGSNSVGLFVLAGESATARRRVLDPAVYREATSRLDNHFTISIVDCGSTLDAAVTQEALRDLDALIVVSSPWIDGASAAGQTMEWLANHGYTGLLHRTVVVLNDSDGHADRRTLSVLFEQFGSRGQAVIEVPYDPHLRPGGVIDVNHELNRMTRRRIYEIAASIAEHFVANPDTHRERR